MAPPPPRPAPGRTSRPPRSTGRPAGSGVPARRAVAAAGAGFLRPRPILATIAILVVLAVIGTIGTYFYLNSQLNRQNILVSYPGRPAPGSGTNWLIAGSDSRQGLTTKQEREYRTGFDIGGQRSDTILILHIPSGGGKPMLISIPRDSYVKIPGYGYNKINAAYAFGGPKLMAETVQNATGLYISHYMEIGFGGFVHVVNAVGGVRMCLPSGLHDTASGVDLHKGCQVLSGGEALAYVRDRHSFATQDLQREQDQRLFLKSLLAKITSTGVILNPFKAMPAAKRDRAHPDRGPGRQPVEPLPGGQGPARGADDDGADRVGLVRHLRGRRRAVEQLAGQGTVQRPEHRPGRAQDPDHRLQAGRVRQAA